MIRCSRNSIKMLVNGKWLKVTARDVDEWLLGNLVETVAKAIPNKSDRSNFIQSIRNYSLALAEDWDYSIVEDEFDYQLGIIRTAARVSNNRRLELDWLKIIDEILSKKVVFY